MSPIKQSLLATRRSMAVGVWSSLVVPMALVSTNVSLGLSVVMLLLVSILSSAALLLIGGNWSFERNSDRRQRYTSATVSFVIPLLWAILFGWQSSPLIVMAFVVVAVVPVTAVWLALMSRVSLLATKSQSSVVSERTAVESIPLKEPTIDACGLYVRANDETADMGDDEFSQPQTDESSFNADESESSDITQWLKRSMTVDGEIIEGGVRIDFAEGQRDATVHVSFCPPFQSIPEVTTEDLDGADLEIRVAATFPFGARLTVRRPAHSTERGTPTAAETCRIGFVAVAGPVRRAA